MAGTDSTAGLIVEPHPAPPWSGGREEPSYGKASVRSGLEASCYSLGIRLAVKAKVALHGSDEASSHEKTAVLNGKVSST